MQPVGKLADGHGNTARAEVVAALDKLGRIRVAEQSLEFALFGRVTFLDFRAALFERRKLVRFRRAGCTAAAVTAGSAAEQHNNVARNRHFTADIFRRRRTHDRADFHTLGDIAGVINFIDLPGGKTDLVAVGAVPRRRGGNKFSLREFAGHGVFDRF